MKTLTVTVLAGALLASSAGLAAAQAGRHVPAEQMSQPLPSSVMGGSGFAVYSHRAEQGDAAVYVKVVNSGECVMGVQKQRLSVGRRGRDRFLVQPGHTVFARYEKADFDVTLSCAEPQRPGDSCDGDITFIPVRRGEPDASMGRLGELEIYSGEPMPSGATCGDPAVDLPLIHVKYGRTRLDATVVNGGSPSSGCLTFEVTTNGSTLVEDFAGDGGGAGVQWFDAVEDARLAARCTGAGGGCQGTVRLTLSP